MAAGRATKVGCVDRCRGFRLARQLAAGCAGTRRHACEAVPDASRPKKTTFRELLSVLSSAKQASQTTAKRRRATFEAAHESQRSLKQALPQNPSALAQSTAKALHSKPSSVRNQGEKRRRRHNQIGTTEPSNAEEFCSGISLAEPTHKTHAARGLERDANQHKHTQA